MINFLFNCTIIKRKKIDMVLWQDTKYNLNLEKTNIFFLLIEIRKKCFIIDARVCILSIKTPHLEEKL